LTDSSLGRIVEASLDQVWNQRDPAKRMAALEQLYRPDAILYEAEREVHGLAAISAAVEAVLAGLPTDFRFVPLGTAAGHHGIAIARWAGRSGDAVLVTGHDVAAITEGRIATLHVFLDPA
jgi:hypothetical protein